MLFRSRIVSERFHAQVLVVPVPYGPYVSRRQWETMSKIGFQVEEEFLTSPLPDDIILRAAEQAGVPSVSLMAAFRDQAMRRELYFLWDGHFKPAGHELFADQLLGPVADDLTRRP